MGFSQFAGQNVNGSAAVAQTEQNQKVLTATRCSEGQAKNSKTGPGRQTLQMFLLLFITEDGGPFITVLLGLR